jgi:chloride channel protein, CIC family
MLMVAEMTGNLSMLAPAMIAVGISSIIVGNATIYTSQVDSRADSPAHRLQLSFPLLSTLSVCQAMTTFPLHFSREQSVMEAEKHLAERAIGGACVLDGRGNLLGVLTVADIGRVPPEQRGKGRVEEAMNRDVLVVQPDDTLDVALEQLTSNRIGWMPVVEVEPASGNRHLVGRISAQEIVLAYRETLAKGSRRMRGLVEGTVMIEALIEPGMPLSGRPLREAKLPAESLVVSIRRHNEWLFPRGSTIIDAGDMVTFLVSPIGEERLQHYLAEREKQEATLAGD